MSELTLGEGVIMSLDQRSGTSLQLSVQFMMRLSTYRPVSTYPDPQVSFTRLSTAGFFYTGSDFDVQCQECGKILDFRHFIKDPGEKSYHIGGCSYTRLSGISSGHQNNIHSAVDNINHHVPKHTLLSVIDDNTVATHQISSLHPTNDGFNELTEEHLNAQKSINEFLEEEAVSRNIEVDGYDGIRSSLRQLGFKSSQAEVVTIEHPEITEPNFTNEFTGERHRSLSASSMTSTESVYSACSFTSSPSSTSSASSASQSSDYFSDNTLYPTATSHPANPALFKPLDGYFSESPKYISNTTEDFTKKSPLLSQASTQEQTTPANSSSDVDSEDHQSSGHRKVNSPVFKVLTNPSYPVYITYQKRLDSLVEWKYHDILDPNTIATADSFTLITPIVSGVFSADLV